METKELDMLLNGIYFVNLQEGTLIENSILRNIILENQEINIKTKNLLIDRFLNFSPTSRFLEDEENEEIEKKLEEVLRKIKYLTKSKKNI